MRQFKTQNVTAYSAALATRLPTQTAKTEKTLKTFEYH